MGGGMMSGGECCSRTMGSGMMSGYANLTPEQMNQRQYMMGRYVGMRQMMMDQMMQHQNQMMGPLKQ